MVWCMARTDVARRSAVSVDPYAVPMKKATEWPSRVAAPSGSICGTCDIGFPLLSRLIRREWCMPIQ